MSDETKVRDTELIPLAQLARENNIPLRTLRSAILAKRMWGDKRGRDWFSIQSEVDRFKKTYTPHSR